MGDRTRYNGSNRTTDLARNRAVGPPHGSGGICSRERIGVTPGREKVPLRFRPDDLLVHPQHGVVRVVSLETRRFGGEASREYYEIAIAKGTVWVPVDGPSSGLRKLTARGDLPRYRVLLKARPRPLALDSKERKIELAERLKASSFKATCEVVRDLYAFGWSKPLNESSSALLRIARQGLCAEWAAADGVSLAAALTEVEGLLLQGKKACGA